MHPGGIEPPFPGPEPSVLSIRLGMQNVPINIKIKRP